MGAFYAVLGQTFRDSAIIGASQNVFGGYLENAINGAATQIGDGDSIYARIGETKFVELTCNQLVADLSLEAVIETSSSVDVATVANDSITKLTTSASFAIPATATTVERTLSVALRRTDTDEAVWSGKLFVTRTAQGD